MYRVWDVLFNMLYFVLLVLFPFATFYYEAEDADLLDPSVKKSRIFAALCYESVVVIFCLVLVLSLYLTGRPDTNIPVANQIFSLNDLQTYTYTRVPGESPYAFLNQVYTLYHTVPHCTTLYNTI